MAELKDVSDTAFWVAAYRAQESLRQDSLFKDPLAAQLAGERGERISKSMVGHRYVAWTLVIRTVVIDNFIKKLIAEENIDTVINLGAGLDTRPYRLNLASNLNWIEVDYPHMIEFKNERLKNEKPICQLERIPFDLANESMRKELLASLALKSKNAVILTEGVLPYLTEAQVSSLARDLRKHGQFRFWIADYFSPQLMRYLKSNKRRQKQMQNAPFVFFPKEWFSFFAELGWKAREIRYLVLEGEKLGRPIPYPWFIKILSRFFSKKTKEAQQKLSAYVVLEP